MDGSMYSLNAVAISVVLGTIIGIVSGTAGGKVDWFFSRLIDFVLSFPQTLMLIALSGLVGVSYMVLLPVFVGQVFGRGPEGLGMLNKKTAQGGKEYQG